MCVCLCVRVCEWVCVSANFNQKSLVSCLPSPPTQIPSLTSLHSSGLQEADLLEAMSPKLFGWLPVKCDQQEELRLLERNQRKIGIVPSPWSLSTCYASLTVNPFAIKSIHHLASLPWLLFARGFKNSFSPFHLLAQRWECLPSLVSCWVLYFFCLLSYPF